MKKSNLKIALVAILFSACSDAPRIMKSKFTASGVSGAAEEYSSEISGNSDGDSLGGSSKYICRDTEPLDHSLLKAPELFKMQYRNQLFADYQSCESFRQRNLKSLACSDVVVSTLTACIKTVGDSRFVLEFTFGIPLLIDGDRPVFPYNYFLNDLDSCERALEIVDQLTDDVIPAYGFTNRTTKAWARCLNPKTMRIQVQGP